MAHSGRVSGPVSTVDAPPTEARASAVKPACVEVFPSRESTVGAMHVRRALPRKAAMIVARTAGAVSATGSDPRVPQNRMRFTALCLGPVHTVALIQFAAS